MMSLVMRSSYDKGSTLVGGGLFTLNGSLENVVLNLLRFVELLVESGLLASWVMD